MTYAPTEKEVVEQLVPTLRAEAPRADSEGVSGQSLIIFYRSVLLRNVRNQYEDMIRKGFISRNSRIGSALTNSCDEALEAMGDGLCDWMYVEKELRCGCWGWWHKAMARIIRIRPLRWSPALRRRFSS